MDSTNIRVSKITHRRLNYLKGQMGLECVHDDAMPTIDDVINAGLDLLEQSKQGVVTKPLVEMARAS